MFSKSYPFLILLLAARNPAQEAQASRDSPEATLTPITQPEGTQSLRMAQSTLEVR